jgi:crooked neck
MVLDEVYFLEFAKFELKNKEFDRTREILKFGLNNINKDK